MPDVKTLKLSITGGQQLVDALRRKGPAIARVLMSRLDRLMIMLSSYIVSQKLSGQVLKRRSGVLSGSVRAIPATIEPHKITAGVEAGAGPAGLYAGRFEFGTSHPYQIMATKARALRFVMDGKVRFARQVTIPVQRARPYMAPSLEEKSSEIRSSLEAALNEEINRPD